MPQVGSNPANSARAAKGSVLEVCVGCGDKSRAPGEVGIQDLTCFSDPEGGAKCDELDGPVQEQASGLGVPTGTDVRMEFVGIVVSEQGPEERGRIPMEAPGQAT